MTRPARTTMWAAEFTGSPLSRRPQDDAIARRAGDGEKRALGVLQWINRVRLNWKRLEMSTDETGSNFPQHRAGRGRRQPQRVDADIGVLAAIEFQDIERHGPLDGGDQDLTPPQRQRSMRRLKIRIADGVEHDVGALAAREFANPRGNIGRGSVDHLDLRGGVAFIGLILARHADHARAVPACDLRYGLPDLAIDAHHQQRLVLVRTPAPAPA